MSYYDGRLVSYMAEFNAIHGQNEPLAAKVANQISRLIQNNRLGIGERLPNEFELATKLNVGRGTVREAVKLLVARNVLVIKRGKGTFVAKAPGIIDDPLGFHYVQDKMKLIEDLLEVRSLIEPWVAATAALNATPEAIEKILDQCVKVEKKIHEGVSHSREDIRLHTLIAESTGNHVMPALIPVINQSVEMLVELTKWSLGEETIQTHRRIVEAIRTRNPEAARHAMEAHLDFNRQRLAVIKSEK